MFLFPRNMQDAAPPTYSNEYRGSNLTPFLPSNQLPGPFRPIFSTPRNYTTSQQYQSSIDSPNNIRYSAVNNILKESMPIALTSPNHLSSEVKPIFFACQVFSLLSRSFSQEHSKADQRFASSPNEKSNCFTGVLYCININDRTANR